MVYCVLRAGKSENQNATDSYAQLCKRVDKPCSSASLTQLSLVATVTVKVDMATALDLEYCH